MSWVRTFLLSIPVMLCPVVARAQSAGGDAVCLGFSFGTWKPKLDWRAAGHGEFPDSTRLQHAANGRDWAFGADKTDTSIVLVPSWWPAGVVVLLPNREPAQGDTVSGDAIAMRANGASLSPRTRVRAWRVPCDPSNEARRSLPAR
jgi:hypothetical protein